MLPFLTKLKNALSSLVTLVNEQIKLEQEKIDNENQTEMSGVDIPTRNELILQVAASELGVKELKGSANNSQVVQYHKYASKSNEVEQPDSVPWCSSFVCFVVENVFPTYQNPDNKPMGSTNSMMARSWLKWGVSTKDKPLPGDIVVYWRGEKSGWQGHVGIFLKENRNGTIITLGGNQSDEVNISSYSRGKLLDYRRSSKARKYTQRDVERLKNMAQMIIDGETIQGPGSLT